MGRIMRLSMAVVVLAAGCGSETGVESEVGAPTTKTVQTATTAAVTTTSRAATTTEAETTTTTTEATGCGDTGGLDTIERRETHLMDVDGDGADDEVTVFFDDSDGPHFGLLVEYASGGSARLDRPIYAVTQPLIPLGLHDVDGDG